MPILRCDLRGVECPAMKEIFLRLTKKKEWVHLMVDGRINQVGTSLFILSLYTYYICISKDITCISIIVFHPSHGDLMQTNQN